MHMSMLHLHVALSWFCGSGSLSGSHPAVPFQRGDQAAPNAQVLSLLVRYAEQSREKIAALGVELLQRAVIQLAPALDEAAWQGVMCSLSLACSPELATPLFRHRSLGDPRNPCP